MLSWANQFSIFCFLDNQQYEFQAPAFDCILAAGCKRRITASAGNALTILQELHQQRPCWLFGHLSYDLKNETEPSLQSAHPDSIGFDALHFFEPEILLRLGKHRVDILGGGQEVFDAIAATALPETALSAAPIPVSSRFTKAEYVEAVEQVQAHIRRGDCYELNFCQEFYATGAMLHPLTTFHRLTCLSPNPFAALYRVNDCWCLCASPERYLKRQADYIFSQPIKGTSRRHLLDELADEASRQQLLNSAKERSENVMVVDLVRNDLSRICKEGTVQAEELFGVYSFPQVHQLISTVSGRLLPGIALADIIRATFPMGSMTGAPKKRVMELTEKYERTRRGLFSGGIGYITPQGDFDFNVVIRSILYNSTRQYLSFQTGGAITFYSDAVQEYEECMLKAAAIRQVLGG